MNEKHDKPETVAPQSTEAQEPKQATPFFARFLEKPLKVQTGVKAGLRKVCSHTH
jgi:hypothetical protein